MSRIARSKIIAPYYHIMSQGINKSCIFEANEDKLYFIKQMNFYKREFNISIDSYCIMTNHYHILINNKNIEDITKFMHTINTKYASYYNNKYKRVGYVFRDRYKSQPILDECYYNNCVKYIFNNPVKAGLCREPFDYEYSNIKDYIKKKNIDNFNVLDDYNFIDISEEIKTCSEIVEEFLCDNNLKKEYLTNEKEKLQELIKILKIDNKISFRRIAQEININRESLRQLLNK